MIKLTAAIDFIENCGDPVEQARLEYLVRDRAPSRSTIDLFRAAQRQDGGWEPFWAPGYSSLDATCFRLAQAAHLGLDAAEPCIAKAVRFIAKRQQADGSWEEDEAVKGSTPPWVKPGETSARLYLTANCGYWLAALDEYTDVAVQGADYLATLLAEDGRLPSYLQAHWLAGGLWYCLRREEEAERVFGHLTTKLARLSASELAWLVTSLRKAGVPADYPLVAAAVPRMVCLQQQDGRWQSDDGEMYDVHATLEMLCALRLCGRI